MPDENAGLSLFGESSPEASSRLEVVHARFDSHAQSSFENLISGYSSMKVLTYSNSISIINRAAKSLDRMEIVFGCEDVIGGMGPYFQFQEHLVKDLAAEVRGKDVVERKISSGDVKLYVVTRTAMNHEKLFLLEGEEGTRVITGLANFSESAFSGRQNESYILFDDDEGAWEYFGEKYERIKANSATSISKKAVLAERFDPANSPALNLEEDAGGSPTPVTLTLGKPLAPSVVHKVVAPLRSRKHEGLGQVVQARKGRINIDRQTASRIAQYIKSNSRSEQENPEEYLSADLSEGRIVLSGKVLDLAPAESDVARDAKLMVEYFRGYERFRGDADKLAHDYFAFMSWLYAGPFACDLRNAALAGDEHVLDLPVFGVLYGKSNCGKSELVRTLLISMFQKEAFLPNDWFTASRVQGLRAQNKRYPLAFDDLDRRRFNEYAVPLIKEDYVPLEEYPVTVISANADQDTFGTDVRKRALIFYTNASLPDAGENRALANDIRRIRRDLGDALFREYVRRALAALRENRPRDILAFSSEILHGIFAEHAGDLPSWCRNTSMEEYSRAKDDKIKDELLQRMLHNPDAFSMEGNKVVLRLGDVHDLRKLRKDVPDYLISSGSGGNTLVLDARLLKEFLGQLPFRKNGLSGFFARLFGPRG